MATKAPATGESFCRAIAYAGGPPDDQPRTNVRSFDTAGRCLSFNRWFRSSRMFLTRSSVEFFVLAASFEFGGQGLFLVGQTSFSACFGSYTGATICTMSQLES